MDRFTALISTHAQATKTKGISNTQVADVVKAVRAAAIIILCIAGAIIIIVKVITSVIITIIIIIIVQVNVWVTTNQTRKFLTARQTTVLPVATKSQSRKSSSSSEGSS